jgi:hypothetical protein
LLAVVLVVQVLGVVAVVQVNLFHTQVMQLVPHLRLIYLLAVVEILVELH